jgi:hypothetical protein
VFDYWGAPVAIARAIIDEVRALAAGSALSDEAGSDRLQDQLGVR